MGGTNSGRPIGSYDKNKFFHECPVCKETFAGRAGAMYCSHSCNGKAYYRRKKDGGTNLYNACNSDSVLVKDAL